MGFLLLGAVRPSLSPSWSYLSSMVSLPVLPQWDPCTPGPPHTHLAHLLLLCFLMIKVKIVVKLVTIRLILITA